MKLFKIKNKKEIKNNDNNIYHLFLLSIISISFCIICLCGTTWAWFTSAVSTNINTVKSATYSVTVTAIKEDSTNISSTVENNITSITFPSNGTYDITISPNGNANKGYCIVNYKNTNYYTENLISDNFTFIVNATENDALTITPNWGTCSETANILNNENNTIGTSSGGEQTQKTAKLLSGSNFNTKLKENATSATAIIFTDINVPENTKTTDYSISQDESVLGWFVDKTYYISSLESGKKIIADSDCADLFNLTRFTSINLTNLDTSNVTMMNNMFYNCTSLTSITFGTNFNTQNVTNMGSMFSGCASLTSLDLSSFNTLNVSTMFQMFYKCSGLTSITFGENFNTSKVENMNSMFYGCSLLNSLDLSKFNTSLVTDMSNMFNGDLGLTLLDISSFDISENTIMSDMFSGCTYLIDVCVKDVDTQTKMANGSTGISSVACIKVKS